MSAVLILRLCGTPEPRSPTASRAHQPQSHLTFIATVLRGATEIWFGVRVVRFDHFFLIWFSSSAKNGLSAGRMAHLSLSSGSYCTGCFALPARWSAVSSAVYGTHCTYRMLRIVACLLRSGLTVW